MSASLSFDWKPVDIKFEVDEDGDAVMTDSEGITWMDVDNSPMEIDDKDDEEMTTIQVGAKIKIESADKESVPEKPEDSDEESVPDEPVVVPGPNEEIRMIVQSVNVMMDRVQQLISV